MKRYHAISKTVLALSMMIISMGVTAQKKTEMTIRIKEDGKVVKDTIYQFDDADQARHIVKMMEMEMWLR